jgi:glycosyltransferase involved in cell wall biosynthesis
MVVTEAFANNRYKTNSFVNNPDFETNIRIVENRQILLSKTPFFSIVLPIYDQEEIIQQTLHHILNNTTEKHYELIIILDSCSDCTEMKVTNFINMINFNVYKLITNIIVLKSVLPLFETSADNLGFYCSSGEFILEIQADMEILDYGYNMKLLKPFVLDETIIGVSGRCCSNWSQTDMVGKSGTSIEEKLADLPNINKNVYYTGETCIRGPLLLHKEKLKEMNYLDEVNYFLDDSDHDLFARAYYFKKYTCWYVPIDVVSKLTNGSTRKPKDELNYHAYFSKKEATKNGVNGFLNKIVGLVEPRRTQMIQLVYV